MSVLDLELDVVDYCGKKNFQVFTEYIHSRCYAIIIRRLDSYKAGWAEKLKVLVNYSKLEKTVTINIDGSPEHEKRVIVETDFDIFNSEKEVKKLPFYELVAFPEPQRITRKQFNKLFNSDIVTLPTNLYAVGINDGNVYIYNENYEILFMIIYAIKHIVAVNETKKLFKKFYFVICASDGYMENNYLSSRYNAKQIGDTEYSNCMEVKLDNPNEFAILHKEKNIFAQSNQNSISNVIDIPDRYYFYLNRYNEYRSLHNFIPFNTKINKIIFAGQLKGTKYNFTSRTDVEMSQREYFYSDAVQKEDYIIASKYMEITEMVGYKYLLDIDGTAGSWDSTAWKLNSGSVILKVESCWRQWFHNDYIPWVHYVPIKDDFSNIKEQYEWCESHQKECEEMIKKCKLLFEKAYRYQNVIDYTVEKIIQLNNLKPTYVGKRKIWFITNHGLAKKYMGFHVNEINHKVDDIHYLCSKLNPEDLLFALVPVGLTLNNLDLNDLLKRYDSFGKKIVFGADRILSGSLEYVRYKMISNSPQDSKFKYLNSGFYCGQVSEFMKIFEERIYNPEALVDVGTYYTNAFVTNRYDTTLDYHQKLVLCMADCNDEDRSNAINKGTPFIF